MKALGIHTEPHHRPYKIGWIKKGTESKVTEVCRVSFSIGKHYRDELVCDVVDMDACHILFGRPWQHDRDVIHKGKPNTYVFQWKGKKIVLLPLHQNKQTTTSDLKQNEVLVTIPGNQFQQEIKKHKMIAALLIKEKFPCEELIPKRIKKLLEDFSDVALEELPNQLPPLRHTQHQIDLVPRANLPNLPHYKMNPKENEILQSQVED
ncbi:hypothetical protein UlMin_035934 [Ulmus minor]